MDDRPHILEPGGIPEVPDSAVDDEIGDIKAAPDALPDDVVVVRRDALRNRLRSALASEMLARVDTLTGIPNLLGLRERVDEQIARALRFGKSESFGILMIDIDFFKKVNDTYGHPVGDEILRGVVQRLATRVRKGDILARYGGEEFTVLVHRANGHTAVAADDFRKLIEARPFVVSQGGTHTEIPATISIGLALFEPSPARSGQKFTADDITSTRTRLIATADAALYAAKGNGRNRTYRCARPGETPVSVTAEEIEALRRT